MKNNNKGFLNFIIPLVVIIGLIWGMIWVVTLGYGNQTVTTEKITEASIDIVNSGQGVKRTKYLFTEDNTYEIEDRLFAGATRSMDVYRIAKANESKVCELTTIGNRIGFLSMYKTVTKIKCD